MRWFYNNKRFVYCRLKNIEGYPRNTIQILITKIQQQLTNVSLESDLGCYKNYVTFIRCSK